MKLNYGCVEVRKYRVGYFKYIKSSVKFVKGVLVGIVFITGIHASQGANCSNGAKLTAKASTVWVPSNSLAPVGNLLVKYKTTGTVLYYGGDGTSVTYSWSLGSLSGRNATINANSQKTHSHPQWVNKMIYIGPNGAGDTVRSTFVVSSKKCGSDGLTVPNIKMYYSDAEEGAE